MIAYPHSHLPLEGIRIVDLTLAMAGPLSTQRLGELGAEVIKIEAPGGGDFTRHWHMGGITSFGDALPYVTLNRAKRSLVLNLKDLAGREALYRLVETADAVVMNYRPGVAARLGIDYASLLARAPKIVMVSITGYGEEGPMMARPGQDLLLQSFTGLTFNGGTVDGPPHPAPGYVADTLSSHMATEAVLAGVLAQRLHGVGGHFQVSLMDALLELQCQELTAAMILGVNAERGRAPQASVWMEPPYGIYQTLEGYLAIAQADLAVLGSLLALPDLAQEKTRRPAQTDSAALVEWRDRIYFSVQSILATDTAAHWDAILSESGVWVAVVRDYTAFLAEAQSKGSFVEIDHPTHGRYRAVAPGIRRAGGPPPKLTPAPAYGADSSALLLELGYDAAAIDDLVRQGIAVLATRI